MMAKNSPTSHNVEIYTPLFAVDGVVHVHPLHYSTVSDHGHYVEVVVDKDHGHSVGKADSYHHSFPDEHHGMNIFLHPGDVDAEHSE